MYTIEKQGLTVFIDNDTKEPVAVIYFSQSRERIIYTLTKATEEDIIELFSKPSVPVWRPEPPTLP